MSKRKFRIEGDFYVAAVNDEPPQTTSEHEKHSRKKSDEVDIVAVDDEPPHTLLENGKHLRKGSDVVDNYRDFESAPLRFEFAEPEPKQSTYPISEAAVNLDKDFQGTSSTKNDMIAHVWKRGDYIEATPPVGCDVEPDFQPTPPGMTAEMPVRRTEGRYKMTSHPFIGRCVVFNQEQFKPRYIDGKWRTNVREGSGVDAERIRATFSKLRFDVKVHTNLARKEVLDAIQALSKESHKDNDCVCVFILTHGDENDLLTAYNYGDEPFSKRDIWEPFTADKCSSLAGKPKLFFFQACRGSKLDDGVTLVQRQDSQISHCQTDDIIRSYKIPISADFLFAHGCAEGFKSWRNGVWGSWYVETLCKVLDEYSKTTDLLKMLTITARKVATQYKSDPPDDKPEQRDKVEVPSVTSTLTRDLYFTGKPEPKKTN